MNDLSLSLSFVRWGTLIPFFWIFLTLLACCVVPNKKLTRCLRFLMWGGVIVSSIDAVIISVIFVRGNLPLESLNRVLLPLCFMTGLLVSRKNNRQGVDERRSYILDLLFMGVATLTAYFEDVQIDCVLVELITILSLAVAYGVCRAIETIWSFTCVVLTGLALMFAGQMLTANIVVSVLLLSCALVVLVVGYCLIYPFLLPKEGYITTAILCALIMTAYHMGQGHELWELLPYFPFVLLLTLFFAAIGGFLSEQHVRVLSWLFLPLLAFLGIALDSRLSALLFLYGVALSWGNTREESWLRATRLCLPLGVSFIGILLLLSAVAVRSVTVSLFMVSMIFLFMLAAERQDREDGGYWLHSPKTSADLFACALQVVLGICCPVGMMMGVL